MRGFSWPSDAETRAIAAKAKIKFDHPVFTTYPFDQIPSSYNITRFCQHQYYSSGSYKVRQFALNANDSNIYRALVTLDFITPLPRSWSIYAPLPAEAPLTADHIDIASGVTSSTERLWLALNGKVYYYNDVDIDWVQIADLRDTTNGVTPILTICGVDATKVAVAAVYSGTSIYDHCELSVIDGTTLDTWRGHLPKTSTKLGLTAVRGNDWTVHFYVDSWNGKKPVHVRRYYSNSWSASEPILPLDAVDEESSFKVGYATRFPGWNGLVFLTGQLKRQYGKKFGVYMKGPDKFTFGRDLILSEEPTEQVAMFRPNLNYVWAVGMNTLAYAKYIGIFVDDPVQDETLADAKINAFNADFSINQAGKLSLDVPASFFNEHTEDAIPGARLDLMISNTGGTYFSKLGTFSIDRVIKNNTIEGESYQVDCSSAALKKLMDWESDTYFDYLGQAEVHGDPGDLTKLIRFSGAHFETPDDGGLQLESLNDDGMLYTTPSASHGGWIKCKFTNLQVTNTMVGVGLNYGEETLAEAAERLDKKIEDTTSDDRARYGLFAIYYPDPKGQAGGQIWLCDYNTVRKGYNGDATITNAWRVIIKHDVTRPAANGTCVLAMQYQDGYVRVFWANSDTTTLTQVISSQAFLDKEIHPSERENYGRGAIYLRNNPGAHMAYSTTSDCDVIPLYSFADKYAVTGVPLEDRTDKFPSSNGIVKMDDEVIVYEGIAGWQNNNGADRRTLDLDWVPGEIIANAGDGINTPTGTDTTFANYRGSRGEPTHTHGNNYVLQSLNLPVGATLTAVRVWLKKINWPEDEVTVTINQGNRDTVDAGIRLANFVISTTTRGPGSKLTAEGGWMTFFLNTDVTVEDLPGTNQYWIMIRRNKNQNHPSSYSYFQFKKMANTTHAGGAAYFFCEECDATVAIGGDMAFVAYGKVEGVNKEFCIPVKYVTGKGLPASDAGTFFAGCAITVSGGEGVNNCYRIIRSKRHTTNLGEELTLFFVDRSPGAIFDIGTKVRAVPALYGLKRGQSSTLPVAHAKDSFAHLPTSTFALASDFEYFTANEDKTLAEVAEDIARKAGVNETNLCNRGSTYSTPAVSQNLIAMLALPSLAETETETFKFACDSAELTLTLTQTSSAATQITIAHLDLDTSVTTTVLDIISDEPISGVSRLSLYDGHISLWVKGRLVCSTVCPVITWTAFSVLYSNSLKMPTLLIPQAGTRVDNFVMDMGKTGAQLLQNLIGEKRVYFQDDIDGRLKIFVDRENAGYLYYYVTYKTEKTDIGLATRVLLEGGEVVEVSDIGNVTQYGNFFKTFNFSEINSLNDAQYFAGMTMEDMVLNRERVEITASVDPGIEPTDRLTVIMPDSSEQQIVVDAVSHIMNVDDQNAIYDMRLSGRIVPVEEEE